MAALFAVAAVVQFNDPDPVRWVAVYGTACTLSALAAGDYRVPSWIPAVLGAVAFAWAGIIMAGGPQGAAYTHMFDAWEMTSISVEEAREAVGLLIVATWSGALWWRFHR